MNLRELPLHKGGASNLNGRSKDRGPAPFASTYLASVGSTGDSRRYHTLCLKSDILCRIDVPVVPSATMNTQPRPGIETKVFLSSETIRTQLAGRKEAVDLDEPLPDSCRLVFKEAREQPPPYVTYRPSNAVPLHKLLYTQTLYSYDLVFVNEPSREFVQKIFACVGNAFMDFGYDYPGFVSRVTALDFARKLLLFPPQILSCFSKMFRVFEFGPSASNGEVSQTEVDADNLPLKRSGRRGCFVLDQYRGEEFSRDRATDCNCLDLPSNLSVNGGFDLTNLWEVYFPLTYQSHPLGVLDRLLAAFSLKLRVIGSALKEIYKSSGHVQAHSLKHLAVCVCQPWKLFLQGGEALIQCKLTEAFPCLFIRLLGLSKTIIPQPPGAAKEFIDGDFLVVTGVYSYLSRCYHKFNINTFYTKSISLLGAYELA